VSVSAETLEDTLLVHAARDGDRQAFGRLYDRYARMVHGILLARVPRTEVDDLVHDVFLLALRRLPKLREAAAFGGWLATITRNRATDYHRRLVETAELPDDAAADAPEERRSDAEGLAALAAIRSLSEAYRETLILRLVEGMTGPEIAARTGLTPGSVRVNLHRGIQQLRERLQKGIERSKQ
jgi:RNA polymerase sigma-70 factor (ECF subfamily)